MAQDDEPFDSTGKVLRTAVHVADEHGASHVFSPGDTLPGWARARITNPKAWADPTTEAEQGAGGDGAVRTGPPPKGGKGSGRAEWAAYAAAQGVEVTEAMKSKEDIVTALEQAGIATEVSGD